jgi:type IV pilus assembly protein PilC
MAIFKYSVIDKSGRRTDGERDGVSVNDVSDYLYNEGYTVVSISEKIGIDFKSLGNTNIGGMGLKDKVLLTKQLSTMLSAGIPLLQAINILEVQTDKDYIKVKINRIYKLIQGGITLSEAFKKEGGIFNEVQINLLAAGEESGNLVEILKKVADDLEKSKNLRGKIAGAMIYPAIIFIVLLIVLFVMLGFMIPQVEGLYKSLGAKELPFITQVLVDIGKFISSPSTIIGLVILIISAILVYRYYNSTKSGKLVIDRMKLKIPVFGQLIAKTELTEFCRLTSMLISSGIPILEVVEIVAKALGNRVFSSVLFTAREELTKGSSFSLAIAKNNIYKGFPLILVKIIATGEESGKMDMILGDMGKFYEDEVEQITSNLTKLMEPFILVVVGGLVALLAVGIYLPMYQLGSAIGG